MEWREWERVFWLVAGAFLFVASAISVCTYGWSGAFFTVLAAVLLSAELKTIALCGEAMTGGLVLNSFSMFLLLSSKLILWMIIGFSPFLIPKGSGRPFMLGLFTYVFALFITTLLVTIRRNRSD